MKRCSKCKENKAFTEFNRTKANKDGLSYLCKTCNREASKAYRAKHHNRYYDNQKKKRETLETFASNLIYNARTRAEKKGLEFTISADDIVKMYIEAGGRCAVTNLSMNFIHGLRKKANLYKCS